MQISFVPCPCCQVLLACPVGFGADMVMQVRVGINIQWSHCPNCSYPLDIVRFHTPVFQGKAKIGHGPKERQGGLIRS